MFRLALLALMITGAPLPLMTVSTYDSDHACPSFDSCVSDYNMRVAEAQNEIHELFPRFCWSIPSAIRCLATEISSCYDVTRRLGHDERVWNDTLEAALAGMQEICPGSCSMRNATDCQQEMVRAMIAALRDPWNKCEGLRIALPFARACTTRHVFSCPENVRRDHKNVLDKTASMIENVCGDYPYPEKTSLLPSTTHSRGEEGILCFKCRRANNDFECNQQGTERCLSGTEHCETVHHHIWTGVEIYKGCVPHDACRSGCEEAGSRCYQCCNSNLCNRGTNVSDTTSTITTTSTTAQPPTTEGDQCSSDLAWDCISDLSERIGQTYLDDVPWDEICMTHIPATRLRAERLGPECSAAELSNIRKALDFVTSLVGNRCDPKCDVIAAVGCIGSFSAMVDENTHWGRICKYKPDVKKCVLAETKDCPELEKERLGGLLQDVIDRIRDRCEPGLIVDMDGLGGSPNLEEGGKVKYLRYMASRPPAELCEEHQCEVYVDFALELKPSPSCRSKVPISQVVFGTGNKDVSNVCSTLLTDRDWDQWRRVDLASKIDLKYDGDQKRNLTIYIRRVTTKDGRMIDKTPVKTIQLTSVDRDHKALCKSINDPHITTFDGHFYNNFFEGYYVLYKHKRLPFEVQVIYQRCSHKATCNCAVAVKSGDTVFVVDRCRRKFEPGCSNLNCAGPMRTNVFFYNRVTPGTRFFKRNGGTAFEVVLPIGTSVRIKSHQNFLNVFVSPSPADIGETKGLCGMYDGISDNDLTLPNDLLFSGPGSKRGGQPRGFNLAWRVPVENRIFFGVAESPYVPDSFCECQHIENNAPPYHECGNDELVESCDFHNGTEDEITDEIYSLGVELNSNPLIPMPWPAHYESFIRDELDIKETWSPPIVAWPCGHWTRTAAEMYCESYLTTKTVAQKCRQLPRIDPRDELDSCVEDIKTTCSTVWAEAALESLKDQCQQVIQHNTTFWESGGMDIIREVEDSMCPNECSHNGKCFYGACACEANYEGGDCSVRLGLVPDKLTLGRQGLCDIRRWSCRNITVYGEHFINSDHLSCLLERVLVNSTGTTSTGEPLQKVAAHYQTPSQIVCNPPEYGRYRVAVSNDGHNFSSWKVFVPYDAACYECYADSAVSNVWCLRRLGDHCLIDGQCYMPNQQNPTDVCQMCRPAPSMPADDWTKSDEDMCRSRAALIGGITIPVLVVLLLGFSAGIVMHKRKMSRLERKINPSVPCNDVEEAKTGLPIQVRIKLTKTINNKTFTNN